MVVGILDHTETGFMVSLVLLGIGWNWTYVGGTRLLITAYRPVLLLCCGLRQNMRNV